MWKLCTKSNHFSNLVKSNNHIYWYRSILNITNQYNKHCKYSYSQSQQQINEEFKPTTNNLNNNKNNINDIEMDNLEDAIPQEKVNTSNTSSNSNNESTFNSSNDIPSSSNNNETEFRQTNEPYLWLKDGEKNIFVMGTFHYEYSSVLKVQNTMLTFKPSGVIIELCPFRGKKLLESIANYTRQWYYSSRDVESAAIICAQQLNAELIFGDIPEYVTRYKIEQIDKDMAQHLKSTYGFKQPISMNQLQINKNPNHISNEDNNDTINPGDIIKYDGKDCIVDENGNKHDVLTREGFRYVMKYDKHLQNNIVKHVLYDEREKFIIKNIIKCPQKKIICVVGMGHLDGIEKYWQDMSFWTDQKFWMNKIEGEYEPKKLSLVDRLVYRYRQSFVARILRRYKILQ